jgi:membrane protein
MSSQPDAKLSPRATIITWADQREPSEPLFYKIIRYLVRLVLITIKEFNVNNLSLRSSALTYTVLLSMVPVLAMSTAVVKGLGGGDQLKKAAYTYIDTLEASSSPVHLPGLDQKAQAQQTMKIPTAAEKPPALEFSAETGRKESSKKLTDHLRSAADTLFEYVERTNFTTLGTIGMIGILLSVVLVLNHVESAMNCIWKVENGRPLLRKIADYLTLLVLMPISINVAFAASAFLKNPALAAKMDIIIPFVWLQALLLKLLPVFFIAVTLYVMYIFFPNTRVKTLPAVFGAALAAFLWFTVQNIYITLQVGVAKYNAIYGSFATLPLFLAWMYLGWIFILTGAQVAYAVQNLKVYTLFRPEVKPSLKLAAAFDIINCIYISFSNNTNLRHEQLTERLPHYSRPLLEEISELLKNAEIIHCSETTGQLLPAGPEEKLEQRKIIDIILGRNAPDTPGGKKSRDILELAATAASQTENEY